MTIDRNSGVSRSDEIGARVLHGFDPELTSQDFHEQLQNFWHSSRDINEIRALFIPFRNLRGQFAMTIVELAETDRAGDIEAQQSHPAYMTREQRLAIGKLATLLAFRALKKFWSDMQQPLADAQAAVRNRETSTEVDVDWTMMMVKVRSAETLVLAVRTFLDLKWKNILEGQSEEEITASLAAIKFNYRHADKNSPALYMKGDDGELISVNLAEFATGFRTKSGHFLVKRHIDSCVEPPYDGTDWALTAYPSCFETIYSGDNFVGSNGSFLLDHHKSDKGTECNEMIAQLPNAPLKSMSYLRWLIWVGRC